MDFELHSDYKPTGDQPQAIDKLVKGIVFPAPTKTTKGILVCATTHGNTFIGPNAQDQDSREDTAVTTPGMD